MKESAESVPWLTKQSRNNNFGLGTQQVQQNPLRVLTSMPVFFKGHAVPCTLLSFGMVQEYFL